MSNNKLNGINALSYLGVNATTPPQMTVSKHDPTDKDFHNQVLGSLWLNESTSKKLWVLLDVSPLGVDRWGQIYPEESGGTSYYVTEYGTATSSDSILNVLGDPNIVTTGAGDTLTIGLADDIAISGTISCDLSEGPAGFVRSDPNNPLKVLEDSALDGQVVISSSAGLPKWANLTAGANVSITNGENSIIITSTGGSGGDFTFTGDTGTALSNTGIFSINGDSGNITTAASGTGATAKLVISFAASPTFTGLTTSALTLDGFSAGVISCDASGVVSSSKGTNGQVFIGSTAGVPEWSEISEGANVYVNNDANGITIGTEMAIKGDTGEEDIYASLFEVLGDGGNITTAVGLDDTTPKVTISMATSPSFTGLTLSGLTEGVVLSSSSGVLSSSNPAADGKVLISSSTGAPAWHTLTAGANVSITEGHNTITIAAGGAGGSLTFTADGSTSTTASTGTVYLAGDSGNLTTTASGTGATAKVTFAMSTTPDFSSVETVNLTVTGQPTFSNIGAGFLISDSSGVLSSSKPTANGQFPIGLASGGFNWSTLTAGAGMSITNSGTSPYVTIATSAPTTFTGTSGSATTAGGLKILGDSGNISTTASGTGSSAQVVVQIAASPSFTGLTLSGLSAGLAKIGSGGAISSTAPSADGQLLIGASTGTMSWATLTAGSNITITDAANSITISAAVSLSILAKTASYTLALADAGYLITMTSTSAIVLTIPTNASVAFPIGTTIQIYRGGAGSVTISPASGVTLRSAGSYTTLYNEYSMAYLVKLSTNTWVLSGDIG